MASETEIYPVLLGDSAFPFLPWLMKPYGNAIQSKEQRYFNYRLSRAHMVVEGAFGQVKGRWRILLRKNECHMETLKLMSLACIILHNVCIDLEDKGMRAWDLAFVEHTQKQHPREVVRSMLHMTGCRTFSGGSQKAREVQDCLKNKFWDKKLLLDG